MKYASIIETGADARCHPRRDIHVGLLGCGKIGQVHASCLAKIPNVRVVGFADVEKAAAKVLARTHGSAYASDQAEDILRDESIDAVYICTRHDSHADLAIRAARMGKHVFMEKPLALSLEECEAVCEVVEETGVFLMPGFKLRFYDLIKKAKEFVSHPTVLMAQMLDRKWFDGSWVQDPVQGGGNVLSQGCHATDILRFLAGSEAVRVWASGGRLTHPGHPRIDHCVASIEFKNGAIGSWIQGDSGIGGLTGKMFFQIFGNDERSVQLHDRATKAAFAKEDEIWMESQDEDDGFLLENEEFIAALTEKRPPVLSAYDGVQAMRIVLAVEEAIRTGKVQNLTTAI